MKFKELLLNLFATGTALFLLFILLRNVAIAIIIGLAIAWFFSMNPVISIGVCILCAVLKFFYDNNDDFLVRGGTSSKTIEVKRQKKTKP